MKARLASLGARLASQNNKTGDYGPEVLTQRGTCSLSELPETASCCSGVILGSKTVSDVPEYPIEVQVLLFWVYTVGGEPTK
ncbi:hypothetical protein A2U01_0016098 [Trifolium medium]|uniref:Uncharacterized protein n=1 Tax=Trifolium medium TaxID=97028 RepID=A0A392N9I7_9FABA|nr:hypothetical protein [Trifolium medium]